MTKERKIWIDWMKVLGIFFIIWGHSFPPLMRDFIYAFNVPVFFMISGYLTYSEPSFKAFLKKSWFTLLIPYFIICAIKRMDLWISHVGDGKTWLSMFGVLTGFHKFQGIHACTMMWFIFTLFLMKMAFQLWGKSNRSLLMLTLCSLIGCVAFNQSGYDVGWSLTDALLAMPFYVAGYLLATQWSEPFDLLYQYIKRSRVWLWSGIALLLFIAIYFVAPLNPGVEMFKGRYGAHPWLFYLLGVVGSFSLWIISILAERLCGTQVKYLTRLSAGTIVILGFHRDVANPIEQPVKHYLTGTVGYDIGTFFVSILVLLAFIPLLWLVKRYFPLLLGRRKG